MHIKISDISLYYEEYGNGKSTILILPGWGDTRKTFTSIINSLKDKFHIYIIDYPNFGNSSTITYEMTIYDYAKIIKMFIDKKKINNPIIIAHSFGGRITSLLSSYFHINIKKIILFDVAGIKRKKKLKIYLKEKIYKLLKIIIRIFPKKIRNLLKQKLLNAFASSDYKSIPDFLRKTFKNIINEDLKKYYKKINCETLIIWGKKDKDTPLKDAYLLNKLIKDSGLIIYKNASHYSYLDNSYDTLKILDSFLKKDMD